MRGERITAEVKEGVQEVYREVREEVPWVGWLVRQLMRGEWMAAKEKKILQEESRVLEEEPGRGREVRQGGGSQQKQRKVFRRHLGRCEKSTVEMAGRKRANVRGVDHVTYSRSSP